MPGRERLMSRGACSPSLTNARDLNRPKDQRRLASASDAMSQHVMPPYHDDQVAIPSAMHGYKGVRTMTRRLITLTAVASVALAAGCSSVRNEPTPSYGAVGSGPTYSTATTAYDSVQYGHVRNIQQLDT